MKTYIKQEYIPQPCKELPLWNLSETRALVRSDRYQVLVNGAEVPVYSNLYFSFVSIAVADFEEGLQVEVYGDYETSRSVIRPLNHREPVEIAEQRINITFVEEGRIVIEPDEDLTNALYILVSRKIPRPSHVTYDYARGNVYNIGHLELDSGDTVYIEDGAVVSGTIHSTGASNVRIIGNGILYNGNWHGDEENGGEQPIINADGENILIEGITILDGGSWHIVQVGCRNVRIHNVNILGKVITGDGIDIVGCSDVVIEDCFIRANDDCISIKACDYHGAAGLRDVRDINVRNCLFWNAEFGNALEIGYETVCDEIANVRFEDCRILHCEYEGNQSGGCLTIHDADHAYVHDIYYENIVIEDAQEKFVDIKVLDSKYSSDRQRGRVEDIYFKDISVLGEHFPPSIIRGYEMRDGLSRPDNIHFENVTICGQRVSDFRDMHLVKELADRVSYT